MRFSCPRCNVIVQIANHAGDYVHTCNSNIDAIDQEDTLKIGTQTDYTGTFTEPKNFISVVGLGFFGSFLSRMVFPIRILRVRQACCFLEFF